MNPQRHINMAVTKQSKIEPCGNIMRCVYMRCCGRALGKSTTKSTSENTPMGLIHYNDVIITTMTSQILSLTVVYSTVYSDADQRKHQSSASLACVWGIHPAQRASCAEDVSIWWRHLAAAVSWGSVRGGGVVVLVLVNGGGGVRLNETVFIL